MKPNNDPVEKPIMAGGPSAKSKIKSLVDRDKHRFYYNNYDNLDNRDIKVEIF